MSLTISRFRHCFDTDPPIRHESLTWEELRALLLPERPPRHRGRKEEIELWSPADFGDGAKLAASVRQVCALVLDIDDGTAPYKAFSLFEGYERLLHTSYSHERHKPGQGVKSRCRLVVPYSVGCPESEHKRVWRAGREMARAMGIEPDGSCSNLDRWYSLPRVQDDAQPWQCMTTGGFPQPLFDWRTVVAEPEVQRREPSRAVSPVAHTADHKADLAWFARALANKATIPSMPSGKRMALLTQAGNLAGCLHLLPEVTERDLRDVFEEAARRCGEINPSAARQYLQAVDDGIRYGLARRHPRIPRRDRPMPAMPTQEGPMGYANDPGPWESPW